MLYKHVEKSWANYHVLTNLQKVHVYRYICKHTSGQELAKVVILQKMFVCSLLLLFFVCLLGISIQEPAKLSRLQKV
jgi:hypothetical protein